MVAGAAVSCAAAGGKEAGTASRTIADLGDGDRAVAFTPTGATLSLEVARSDAKRARGLMFREEVPDGTGMLFIFEESARHGFWMFQCRTALDIVWLDARWTVVHVAEELPPCRAQPCPTYEPPTAARYVIEVGPARARALGLTPGAHVVVRADRERS